MSHKQITIFGGTGFVGRYVVDQLADAGYTIHVATRRPGSVCFLKTAGTVGQVVPFLCDIHDDKSIAKAIEGSDAVINLIGVLTENGRQNSFVKIHHEFPKRLGQVAKRMNVSTVVHLSAIGASEDAPARYLKTKALGEKALRAVFPKASILRPSVVFGVEDNFFNRFARMAMISPILPLIGGGHTKFQPVYVCDVADAIIQCVTNPKTQGKTYELGGADIHSFKECLELMLGVIGINRRLVTLPWTAARIKGYILQNLPGKLLTRDQVRVLRTDSVVAQGAKTLGDLGINPTPMAMILPTYLARFKPGGRFGIEKKA